MRRCFRLLLLALLPILPCACGGPGQSRQLSTTQREDKEKPAKLSPAAVVAKLVKQLGSSDFTEREAASKALEAIGIPALDALSKAAMSDDAEVAQRAARLAKIVEDGFDQMLADYRAYGLPLPPEDAKLVQFSSYGSYMVNDNCLGFLLQPGTADKRPLLLFGTLECRLAAHTPVEVIEPKPEIAKVINYSWTGKLSFRLSALQAIALQCKARGWNELARELWTLSIQHPCVQFFHSKRASLPNRTAVAHLAWEHYCQELAGPDTDRAKIAEQIESLFAAEPTLNTKVNQALLKSLETALVPSTARPGTVERMIDDLTDMCNASWERHEADSPYSRLAHMGFAAVPALIEHLDDGRLTRSIQGNWNLRVNDVVSDLMQELAGEEVGKAWPRQEPGFAVAKVDAQAWWDKARKVGEEAYLLAHVLPKGEWPHSMMLSIIAEKYPQQLAKVYKTILNERPEMQSWPIAEAVSKSLLPDEEKRELLIHVSRHKILEHRRPGLQELQKLDPQQFMTLLLATLEALPRTPTKPYWGCPEAGFAHLVKNTDDPRAWTVLEKVAKRSDVGLRMELMGPMDYRCGGDGHRQQRLEFLAAFLDDAEVRDVNSNPKMFDGPHAGFTFARLEVRDLAAMQIASIIEMPDQPDKNWTPEQREKLRKKVKEAVKR